MTDPLRDKPHGPVSEQIMRHNYGPSGYVNRSKEMTDPLREAFEKWWQEELVRAVQNPTPATTGKGRSFRAWQVAAALYRAESQPSMCVECPVRVALSRDADRYQWIRSRPFMEIAAQYLLPGKERFDVQTPEQLDNLIDAAIRKLEGK